MVFQLPKEVINDCAQLVKANSIQGSKMNEVDIVYTMWANLNKTADMEVGQIGFHSNKAVKKIRQLSKDNAIVNRLNKTKEEKEVDFKAEREGRDRREREDTASSSPQTRESKTTCSGTWTTETTITSITSASSACRFSLGTAGKP